MANLTFADAVQAHHAAIEAFMAGDTGPFKDLFSQRPDATLANPFGGIATGWDEIPARLDLAASYYADGEVLGIQTISTDSAELMGYTVEIEQIRARIGGRNEFDVVGLRVTSVFRREDGEWRLVHRHADPRVAIQPAESILEDA